MTSRDYTSLFISIAITFLLLLLIEYRVVHFTGNFIYPIDDTFIHMQIARNVAFHSNWGITSTEFGSASSSILYTVLLTIVFKFLSANIFIPLLVNSIAAVLLLYIIQKQLKKFNVGFKNQVLILLLIILLTPLPILIMSGMEHTLQCLFCFLFVIGVSEWLEKTNSPENKNAKLPWQFFLYGAMVTGLRYEGILLIGVVCIIILFQKKIITAVVLGLVSLLPLIIFGIYSYSKGSYILPNSVLVKSEPIQFTLSGILGFINDMLTYKLTSSRASTSPPYARPGITLLATQRLLIILPICYFLFYRFFGKRSVYHYIILIVTACTILHLSFAATGWFYRYEAYLILISVFIIGLFAKWFRQVFTERKIYTSFIGLVLLFALVFPLVLRSTAAFSKAHQASINIYEQQYQMGLFLKSYYNQDTVAANDVGAISYLTNAKILDLWGLGNIDVAKSRKGNYWTPNFIDSLCKVNHAKIAIVYDSWFSPELLNRWQKAGEWVIPNNVICGDDKVSFYAFDGANKEQLLQNLRAFQTKLPSEVKVIYY